MKKILLSIGILISATAIAQTTFKTRINTDSDADIFKIIQLDNGDYVGIGSAGVQSDTALDTILIVRLNSIGTVLSSQVIGGTGDCDAGSIIKTQDGGIAIGGTLNDQLAILKFDGNLNLQWKKQYIYSENGSDGSSMIQATNGDFLIGGDVYDDNDFNAAYLVKTDSQGNLLFAKQFIDFNASGEDIAIFDINETSDGNFMLLAGVDQSNDTTTISIDTTYFIKINPQGGIIWSRYLNTGLNANYSFSMIQSSDNASVSGGYVTQPYHFHYTAKITILDSVYTISIDTIAYLAKTLMTKIDASGNLVWSKVLNTPSDSSSSSAYSVLQDTDGGYIFSGLNIKFDSTYTEDTAGAPLVKLNENGSWVWSRNYDINKYLYENFNFLTDIIPAAGGGYAVCGNAFDSSYSRGDGFIYKLNSNFQICGESLENDNVSDIGAIASVSVANGDLPISVSEATITQISLGAAATYSCINAAGLPVSLLNFSAQLKNKDALLNWQTATEENTSYFNIQRSTDGSHFNTIGKISAAGNSSIIKNYTYTDVNAAAFNTSALYYRLQEVDKDGKGTYSKIQLLHLIKKILITITPNPVNDFINITSSADIKNAKISVIDMGGKRYYTTVQNLSASNQFQIPVSKWAKGTYVVSVESDVLKEEVTVIK